MQSPLSFDLPRRHGRRVSIVMLVIGATVDTKYFTKKRLIHLARAVTGAVFVLGLVLKYDNIRR